MSIEEIQNEIIDEFSFFSDWTEKYEHIISLGKELEPLEEQYKTDENIVKGCQSRVWLHGVIEEDKLCFQADSDAIITKGLVALIVRVFTAHTAEEILNAELFFVDKIGLREHLSPNRSNGLISMIKTIKTYALAYSVKH